MRSAPASSIARQLSQLRMPPAAFTRTRSPTVCFIRRTSSAVAPEGPKPVEVLMKSGSTSRAICASLLLKEGVPMKQIQEWLGHSDISTTANIYAHLDSQSKNLSARTMANTLTLPEAQPIKKW